MTPQEAHINAMLKEVQRLRSILVAYHLDPDRCDKFPEGEQCGLKTGHGGPCKWNGGD